MAKSLTKKLTKKFKRYGRCYHLRIDSAADLSAACELDEAHWVATNAPISTINCDKTFLALLDSDNNGRIIPRELREAIGWTLDVLRDHHGVSAASDTLKLDAINTDIDEGRGIHDAVEKMLARMGLGGAEEISLDQVRQSKAQEQATAVSETGVIIPAAAEDAEIKEFIADIVATAAPTAQPRARSSICESICERTCERTSESIGYRPPCRRQSFPGPVASKTPGVSVPFFVALRDSL